ncbi:MAG: hypothetical protein JRE45_18825, partial [Deltaproteobacteria bacterium]|nr:hypothetical protein [Deltaproteobacteria bacterium]
MIPRRLARTMMIAGILCCATMEFGCKAQEQPSAFIGRYTFSRDYAGERRVLRIEPSAEQPAQCMRAQLPTAENEPWKETTLAPELHRSLVGLLFDERRRPYYEADTETSAAAEVFTCDQLFNAEEFCYLPQVAVTGTGSPWRFGLQSDVTLSDESQELIDEFLSVHDACWSS